VAHYRWRRKNVTAKYPLHPDKINLRFWVSSPNSWKYYGVSRALLPLAAG
jgi:hypothetical protein